MRFCRTFAALTSLLLAVALSAEAQAKPAVKLHWLKPDAARASVGTTWGAPWPQGAVQAQSEFTLSAESGSLPVQSWPLAYWPDGSVKWSGHAIAPLAVNTDSLTLAPGNGLQPEQALTVREDKNSIRVDTGAIQAVLSKSGTQLIESISRQGRETLHNGRLVILAQNQAEPKVGEPLTVNAFNGQLNTVTLEQDGPLRAVVKLEGKHVGENGRAWIPFVVRLYFYAGDDSVRLVHSMIYDGDQNQDFIRGVGVRFNVPMDGPLHDRHVRFSGESDGLFAEGVRGITGLRRDPGEAVRRAQIDGRATPPLNQWAKSVSDRINVIPAFGDYTLTQLSADAFSIRKRTQPGLAWVDSAAGGRSSGLGYIGSPEGGVAFGIRDFWQSHPSQLDIRNAATDSAQVTLWFWSPESRAMDMRFYHDGMGLDTHEKQLDAMGVTYEDYEPGFADATGVARTSELRLWALPATPDRDTTVQMARTLAEPPQMVARPKDYKAAGVFGAALWSLPDRSTPAQAAIEDQLDFYLDHYLTQVEEHHWYGFWDYGDVMHSYDHDRHTWRYDVGGFAWANSELSPDIWLWYSFLRTGRADVFTMAEAMTRHTGEVDVYHLGRFEGLGSRHNVNHWGDSAKQLRISTPANRRFYYYLTADERVGDLMRATLGAERRLLDVPPLRKLNRPQPDFAGKPYSMMMGLGTDWNSVAAAWLTEWERTGEPEYKDKLLRAMRSIGEFKQGLLSSGTAYDPDTSRFYRVGEGVSGSHLAMVFGGVEINAELIQLLDVPEYEAAFIQYGRFFNASREEKAEIIGQPYNRNLNLEQAHSRMTAYSAWKLDDKALAERAWDEFFEAKAGIKVYGAPYPSKTITPPAVLAPVTEARGVSTNAVSQFGLTAIQIMALIGEQAPENIPERD
ncbi:Tat pathway signal sequence domain protein [Gilvimarinus sp. DA14]|uniref:exo-rhamnogalacturonan lyase family protein n=1 Tax=Gilvimarinus sp. DA14 TaxID=2956798 RepID=UPI0020B83F90|nr:Tat pathway signal sequence domain protein [Gilvimarinus sp. DA14]UTF60422.1 Tat pathway signal sequence domain protein [Gilvimarinus sp. DA14]